MIFKITIGYKNETRGMFNIIRIDNFLITGETSLGYATIQWSWTTIIDRRVSSGGECDLYNESRTGRSMAEELLNLCDKLKLMEEEAIRTTKK
jgi:hypothetical protein